MKNIISSVGAEVTRRTILILAAISLLTSAPTSRASTYSITNDLATSFTFFYWTNSNGAYTFSLTNTLAPTIGTNITTTTNGIAGLGIQATNGTAYILIPWTNLPVISVFGSGLFNAALATIAPATETVPQTQGILKSYYITGAIPSQANYWEWIDSMFWYVNVMYTNSQNAVAAATIATNTTAMRAMWTGSMNHTSGGSATMTQFFQQNISNVLVTAVSSSTATLKFIFTNSMPDTNFTVMLGADTLAPYGSSVVVSGPINPKNVTDFSISFSGFSGNQNTPFSLTVSR